MMKLIEYGGGLEVASPWAFLLASTDAVSLPMPLHVSAHTFRASCVYLHCHILYGMLLKRADSARRMRHTLLVQ